MSATDRWLAERADAVPDALARELDRTGEADTVPAALVERALSALSQARGRPPDERAAAYRLLAADAYLTYACEAAAGSEDPGAVLERILERLAADAA